jgi:FtsZ-binding cell division protein ZapB
MVPLAESTNPPQTLSTTTPILVDDSNSNGPKKSSFGAPAPAASSNPTLSKITQTLTPPPAVTVLAPMQVAQPVSPALSQPGKRKATSALGEEPHKKQRKITDMSRVPSEPPALMTAQEVWELQQKTYRDYQEMKEAAEQLKAHAEALAADAERLRMENEQLQAEKAELAAKLVRFPLRKRPIFPFCPPPPDRSTTLISWFV